MRIKQTEQGIEITQTEKGEDLFESMHNMIQPILEKNPILNELTDFVKIDWDALNKELEKIE